MDEQNNSNFQMPETGQKSVKFSTLARLEGNNLFKNNPRQEYRKILFFYSKSIAYAPIDSQDLALGYGNRSALLQHLKLYQESIIDIDRALKITKSDVLKIKLLCRKIVCKKLLNETISKAIIKQVKKAIDAIDPNSEIKSQLQDSFEKAIHQKVEYNINLKKNANLPRIDSDKELPATSTSIHLEYNKRFGRHYRATKNIPPGEMLIIEERYAAVPQKKQLYVICSHCLTIAWNGIPCDSCPCIIYCSDQCKKEAWKLYHELECPIIKIVIEEMPHSINLFLTLRIITRGLQEDPNRSFNYLLKEFILAQNDKDERHKGFKNKIFGSEYIRSIFSLKIDFEYTKSRTISSQGKKCIDVINAKFGELFYSSEFHTSLKNYNIHNFKDFIIYIFGLGGFNSRSYDMPTCECHVLEIHRPDCPVFFAMTLGACSSLLNHSCVPNVNKIFKDGKIILYSMKPIMKNEQIFDSYGTSLLEPLVVRQQYLSAYFRVSCDCEACTTGWDMSPSDEKKELFKAFKNMEFHLISDLQDMLDGREVMRVTQRIEEVKGSIKEWKSKITRLHQSNSLCGMNKLYILHLTTDLFRDKMIAYYGDNIHIPEDLSNNS